MTAKRIVLAGVLGACLLLPGRATAQRAGISQRADTLIAQAAAAYLEARYPEAVRFLSGIPADSLSSRGLFTLGSALAAMNESERAIQLLRKALEREPGSIAYRYQLARTLSSLGLSQEAEEEYSALLGRDSHHVAARFNWALLAFDRRDFAVAAGRFQEVIARNPRDYLSLYYLGLCYASLDSDQTARAYLGASLTLNPHYAPTLNQLASLYYRQPDYSQALRLYRQALRDRPEQPENWYNEGLCLEKLEDWRGARDSFREAIRRDSTKSLYHAHLGQAYFQLERYDSAAEAYSTAIRFDEENPVLLLNLGLTYARMNDAGRAEEAFRGAVNAYEPAQIARVYNQLGGLYFTGKRYRDARKAYQSALLYDPGNLDALFSLAVTLDHLELYAQAKETYRRYLSAAKEDPSLADRVGVAKKRIRNLK